MADKPTLFTVTDRRKFTTDGALREGRPSESESAGQAAQTENFATPETASTTGGPGLHLVGTEGKVDASPDKDQEDPTIQSRNAGAGQGDRGPSDGGLYDSDSTGVQEAAEEASDDGLGPAPTAAETADQNEAYQRSSTLLDDMVQQANPSAPPAVQMDFEQLVQSIYLSAIVAMGAGGQPGEKPRIDIIGARQSIDMLAVLGEKTKGNLTQQEERLLQTGLFNLRMMFLEITNAIAAQAQRGPAGGQGAGPGGAPSRGPGSAGPQRPGPRK